MMKLFRSMMVAVVFAASVSQGAYEGNWNEAIDWTPHSEAFTLARNLGKPLMVILPGFDGHPTSEAFREQWLAMREEVEEIASEFVMVLVPESEESELYENQGGREKYEGSGGSEYPRFVFLYADGPRISTMTKFWNVDNVLQAAKQSLGMAQGEDAAHALSAARQERERLGLGDSSKFTQEESTEDEMDELEASI